MQFNAVAKKLNCYETCDKIKCTAVSHDFVGGGGFLYPRDKKYVL